MHEARRKRLGYFLALKVGALRAGNKLLSPVTGVPFEGQTDRFLRTEAIRKRASAGCKANSLA